MTIKSVLATLALIVTPNLVTAQNHFEQDVWHKVTPDSPSYSDAASG